MQWLRTSSRFTYLASIAFIIAILILCTTYTWPSLLPLTSATSAALDEPEPEWTTSADAALDVPDDQHANSTLNSPSPDLPHETNAPSTDKSEVRPQDLTPLALPEAYNIQPFSSEWCERAYGHSYLQSYRDHHHSYCQPDKSSSAAECFVNRLDQNSFCVFDNVLLQPSKKTPGKFAFGLECEQRDWRAEGFGDGPTAGPEGKNSNLFDLREHMMNTGLGYLLQKNFKIYNSTVPASPAERDMLSECAANPDAPGYVILVKRDLSEGAHHWHSMMEIMSLHWTIDAMRITRNEANGHQPYFTDADLENSQIVILDDQADGPFFDMWSMVARKPPVRLSAISKDPQLKEAFQCLNKVLVPLAGGASPLWKGDWEVRPCTSAPLLDAFTSRVLAHYNNTHDRRPMDAPPVVTIVERHTSRQLADFDTLVTALRSELDRSNITAHVQTVDWGTHSWPEQLQIAQETDVLVGVHGAGLSLGMWMPPDGAMVEIMPGKFRHKGFRNLAKIAKHRYFRAFSSPLPDNKWQSAKEVAIEKDRFVELVKTAVASVLQTKERDGNTV